jgi:imidazolonepropionase-like amidohydrolase
MKRIALILGLHLLLAEGFGQSTFPETGISDKAKNSLLLTNARIHVEPGLIVNGDLWVVDDRIVSTGKTEEEDRLEGMVVIDLDGAHVFPSFVELNADYGLEIEKRPESKEGPNTERSNNVGTYWNESFHPEYEASLNFTPNEKSSTVFLKKGFGLALTHSRNGICRGTSALVLMGSGNANDKILRSTAAMHFSFEKGSSTQDYPTSLMGAIALIRQGFYDAHWYETGSPDEINLSLEALNEHRDIPFIFSVQDANDLLRVSKLAEEFDLRFSVIGGGDEYRIAESIGAGIRGLISPLDFPGPFDMSDPELSRMASQADLLHWERAPFNPRITSSFAERFVLSGARVEKEDTFFANLRKAITCGLNPDSALAALTVNPLDLLNVKKSGKLLPTYRADFFISDKDPFREDGARIISHYIGGEKIYEDLSIKSDFEGTYDITVDDVFFRLDLSDKNPKTGKVSLIVGDDTLQSKASFSHQGNEVVLSFADPTGDGYYRLAGTSLAENRIWDGLGEDPFGRTVKWSAIRQKEKRNQAARPDTAVADSLPPIPAMLFPPTAYGSDSLPEAVSLLIENATIWTCDTAGVIKGGKLLINDGKIIAVGKEVNVSQYISSQGIEVIDGTGLHVTPGIIDEHSHIAITRGVNEGTRANTAEVRIGDAINPDDINIYRQLAGGVTSAQLLHGSANPIGGQSAIVKMRWGEDPEDMVFREAPGFIKFALGENVKQSNWGDEYNERYPQTRMGVEQFLYNELHRAKDYGQVKRIFEGGKDKRRKQRGKYRKDLQLEALLEVLNEDRFVTCHSYVQSEINMLMHVADSMGFTLNTFTHILEGYKVADKMKAHGAAASTFSDWWAYKFEVRDAIPYNAAVLSRMGVLTAINSDDAEMGRRLNQEAAKAVLYGGMSEVDALKLVTINPAKILHIDEFTGSITPGKHADLVIWNDHPLSVYAKALKTFVDGKLYFDREEMERRYTRDRKIRTRIAEKMSLEAEKGAKPKKPKREVERYYHCETTD